MSKKVKRWICWILYLIGSVLILYFVFGGNHNAYTKSKRKGLKKKLKKKERQLRDKVIKLQNQEEVVEGNVVKVEKKLTVAKEKLKTVRAKRDKLVRNKEIESMTLSEIADALAE